MPLVTNALYIHDYTRTCTYTNHESERVYIRLGVFFPLKYKNLIFVSNIIIIYKQVYKYSPFSEAANSLKESSCYQNRTHYFFFVGVAVLEVDKQSLRLGCSLFTHRYYLFHDQAFKLTPKKLTKQLMNNSLCFIEK